MNSEYITGVEVFSGRVDAKTLRPFLHRLERFQQIRYEEVVEDAGYESLGNYLYLESTGQTRFIEPTNYDQKKSRKFKKQVGLVENMICDPEEDSFTCVQGRRLTLRRSVRSKERASLSLRPGTAARTVPVAPAATSAAGPRTRLSQRNFASERLSGKNRNRQRSELPLIAVFIFAYAISPRWSMPLGCSKATLVFCGFLTRGKASIRAK